MKKSLFNSVVISAIIGLSTSAFAATTNTTPATKTPTKVESKTTNTTGAKKMAVKPAVKVQTKMLHTAKKSNVKMINTSIKKH